MRLPDDPSPRLELLFPNAEQVKKVATISGGWKLDDVLYWLLSDSLNYPSVQTLLKALGLELIKAGAPIWRLRYAARTIHPLLASRAYSWVNGDEEVSVFRSDHGVWQRDTFLGSPNEWVTKNNKVFRLSLEQKLDEKIHHRVLFQLQEQGATDYLGIPMPFSNGELNSIYISTDKAGGFSNNDCEKFKLLSQSLIPVFETISTREIARIVMETYVGHRTGNKVLNGQIKRGDGELIKAAIWYSDLRDFTLHSEVLPPDDLLRMLNQYFETIHQAVDENGGEVLRFIGDAMLIIFPEETCGSIKAACNAALNSSIQALKKTKQINKTRLKQKEPEIKFGVGLHFGEVIYGNVGAPNRLDFTVMGPAVNRTARLESMTKELNRNRLMSRAFADQLSMDVISLGHHTLKGIKDEQEICALAATI